MGVRIISDYWWKIFVSECLENLTTMRESSTPQSLWEKDIQVNMENICTKNICVKIFHHHLQHWEYKKVKYDKCHVKISFNLSRDKREIQFSENYLVTKIFWEEGFKNSWAASVCIVGLLLWTSWSRLSIPPPPPPQQQNLSRNSPGSSSSGYFNSTLELAETRLLIGQEAK